MSVWQAKQGESKPCVVTQEVLAVWWTRKRAHPGETVKLGAFFKDVKEGSAVQFEIRTASGPDVLKTLDGKVESGKCELDWKVELPEKPDWPSEVPLVFDAVVGKLRSRSSQRERLDVDAGLPPFSL